MNRGEEYVGGFRLRPVGDALIVDERARHPVFEIPRLLLGLAMMAPSCVLFGAMILPDGVLGFRRNPEAAQMSAKDLLPVALFICLAIVFLFAGLFHAFSRMRVVVGDGKVSVGRTWLGASGQIRDLALSAATVMRLHTARRGILGGVEVFAVSIVDGSQEVELFSCGEKEAALKLADAVGNKVKLPLHDETGT